jgi:hypothetical protein
MSEEMKIALPITLNSYRMKSRTFPLISLGITRCDPKVARRAQLCASHWVQESPPAARRAGDYSLIDGFDCICAFFIATFLIGLDKGCKWVGTVA